MILVRGTLQRFSRAVGGQEDPFVFNPTAGVGRVAANTQHRRALGDLLCFGARTLRRAAKRPRTPLINRSKKELLRDGSGSISFCV